MLEFPWLGFITIDYHKKYTHSYFSVNGDEGIAISNVKIEIIEN